MQDCIFGRAKHARRVKAMDGFHQPARAGSTVLTKKIFEYD